MDARTFSAFIKHASVDDQQDLVAAFMEYGGPQSVSRLMTSGPLQPLHTSFVKTASFPRDYEAVREIAAARLGLTKEAFLPQGAGRNFLSAAKAELGPAVGAVLGAGTANVFGVNPLAGAAAGYGLGAIPEISHSVRERLHQMRAAPRAVPQPPMVPGR